MILSRHIARRRIAAGVRPGWFAAWGPVAVDALSLVAVLVLLLRLAGPAVFDWPVWGAVAALVLLVFVPVQLVLGLSAFWATRSRWVDQAADGREL